MKTIVRSLFIALTLFAVLPAQTAPLQLGIARAGKQAVLSWSATGTNYILESTTNLASTNWLLLTNIAPVVTNTNATVIISFSPVATYFRLFSVNTSGNPTNTGSTTGMAPIPSGTFTMGDTLDGETDAPPTSVTLSAYYMDTNLVSYSQWLAIYNWATSKGYDFVNAGAGKATNHPVQQIDWFDAVKWCNARSQLAGLTPVYYTDSGFTQLYTNGEVAPYANWSATGYRLPTEAEWERAARAGLSGLRFPWGDTISESQANYVGNTFEFAYDSGPTGFNPEWGNGPYPYTSPVGYFAANDYGLYDMAGNVLEWCWDWYGTTYAGGTNPTGPASGSSRVLRGGSWGSYANTLSCAYRINSVEPIPPSTPVYSVGFRCVTGP